MASRSCWFTAATQALATPNADSFVLELIKRAVESGELDTLIESASNKLREGFAK